ncbi:hypothetical protein [Flavobacterium sp.]|jgi:hypothetical protein|uniref:C1q-like domain-containing protein n=1 Tax=Flavobacterium sp. TaxID=239 RepID=UPI0037BE7A93
MGYLGSVPVLQSTSFTGVNSQAFSPNGSTAAFTMNRTVANTKDIEVIVDNVQQSPYDGSYSVSGTIITFSENPPAGTNSIYIIYRDAPIGSITDPLAVKKAGDTMTGDLVIQGDTKRIRVTDNTRYLTLGQWDGVTNRIESSGAEMLMVQYGASNKLRLQHASVGDALTIDSGGRVQQPLQPSFSVYTNIERYWNSNAFSPIVFEQTRYNIGNHYNTSTGIFTAPVAGKYWVNSWIMWMSELSFTFMYLAPQVNGLSAFEFMRQGDRSDYSTFGGSMTLDLQAGDQVRIALGLASVDSGYLRSGVSMNQFEMRLVA